MKKLLFYLIFPLVFIAIPVSIEHFTGLELFTKYGFGTGWLLATILNLIMHHQKTKQLVKELHELKKLLNP